MTPHRIVLIIIWVIFWTQAIGQRIDKISILDGQGIVFNNDSILLDITSVEKTCKLLRIKNPKTIEILDWDNFVEGKSGISFRQELNFKDFNFEYLSENNENDLKLVSIKINGVTKAHLYDKNGIEIQKYNPPIKNLYSLKDNDFIADDELTYILDSYGLTFILGSKMENNMEIKEILIYKKK